MTMYSLLVVVLLFLYATLFGMYMICVPWSEARRELAQNYFWFTLEIKTMRNSPCPTGQKRGAQAGRKATCEIGKLGMPHFENLQHYNPIAWAS